MPKLSSCYAYRSPHALSGETSGEETLACSTSGFGGLSAFGFRSAGKGRPIAGRAPSPWYGAPTREPPPAWHTYWFGRIGASCVSAIESRVWGCGFFQSGHEARRGDGLTPGGVGTEAESAATPRGPAALGVPLLRAPEAPLMEFFEGPAGRRAARVRTT